MSIGLHSEPKPPTGGLVASGVRNALGRPDLDFWSLFVREAAQNSLDAIDPEAPAAPAFHLQLRRLDELQHDTLSKVLLGERPDDRADVWSRIDASRDVLVVEDFGTLGLGGPLLADESSGEVPRFANFVWNVGQAAEAGLGGGTYGYGKSVLYRASSCGAIVVYTRCRTRSGAESRLIACALGSPYESRPNGHPHLFTGRHWWGDVDGASIRPLTGDAADRMADALGIGRGTGDVGTTILIVAPAYPRHDEDDPDSTSDLRERAASRMAEALIWYCWPRLIESGELPQLSAEVTLDGRAVPLADPASHPDLKHFVTAYRLIEAGHPDVMPVGVKNPVIATGRFALSQHADLSRPSVGRPWTGAAHHTALLRHPRLVVRYLAGPVPVQPRSAWSGVFLAHDEVDRAFAASEPPAHDDWNPKSVEDRRQRSIVNVSLTRLRELSNQKLLPAEPPTDGQAVPVGALSESLGALLPTGIGTSTTILPGAGSPDRPSTVPTPRAKRSVVSILSQRLAYAGGLRLLMVEFEVEHAPGSESGRVWIEPRVAVNDGYAEEGEPPIGAEVPRLLRYEHPVRGQVAADAVDVRRGDGPWVAVIGLTAEAAVIVRPRVEDALG